MKKFLIMILFISNSWATEVKLSQIKTGEASSSEYLVYNGGEIFKRSISNHTAFLVKHDDEYILFDTGLGTKIDEQFKTDMPWWGKAVFSYENVSPAAEQLKKQNIEIKNIFLSHLHWDHASGLVDFPSSKFHVPTIEMTEIYNPNIPPKAAAFLKTQFDFNKNQWNSFEFNKKEFMGFDESYDIFGDQTVVLIPLPGHTLGSAGMIVTTAAKKYFLIGDLVWRKKALETLSPKFFAASLIVDGNRDQVMKSIEKVLAFHKKYPEVEIVPTHDEEVQGRFGYFPDWVKE